MDSLPELHTAVSPLIRIPNPTVLALLRGVVERGDPWLYLPEATAVDQWFRVAEHAGLVEDFKDPHPTETGDALYAHLHMGRLPVLGRYQVWPPVWPFFYPVGAAVVLRVPPATEPETGTVARHELHYPVVLIGEVEHKVRPRDLHRAEPLIA